VLVVMMEALLLGLRPEASLLHLHLREIVAAPVERIVRQ